MQYQRVAFLSLPLSMMFNLKLIRPFIIQNMIQDSMCSQRHLFMAFICVLNEYFNIDSQYLSVIMHHIEEYNAEHTHEEFQPIIILNSILELFDLCFIKFKLTYHTLVHIFCQPKSNDADITF